MFVTSFLNIWFKFDIDLIKSLIEWHKKKIGGIARTIPVYRLALSVYMYVRQQFRKRLKQNLSNGMGYKLEKIA